MEKKHALVLLSGGQDSTTCLYWALENFDVVDAIGFYYNQKHEIENKCAAYIADHAGVDFELINVSHLLHGSSLTNHNEDHNEKSKFNSELPASFTPGRNILFLTIAAIYAAKLGVKDLVTGVCQTDYSGYPDCRRNAIDAIQLSLSLGMGIGDIKIHTPLMYLTKAETWKLAKDLGCLNIIISDTMTDYNGDMTMNEWGRGNKDNPATKLRMHGYYEAKQKGWL